MLVLTFKLVVKVELFGNLGGQEEGMKCRWWTTCNRQKEAPHGGEAVYCLWLKCSRTCQLTGTQVCFKWQQQHPNQLSHKVIPWNEKQPPQEGQANKVGDIPQKPIMALSFSPKQQNVSWEGDSKPHLTRTSLVVQLWRCSQHRGPRSDP